jgi:hypothetical protein
LAKSLLIDRFLTGIALPHQDNVSRFVARRPNKHHHSTVKKTDGLEAFFTVIAPGILYGNRWTSKDDRCIGKIQTLSRRTARCFAGSKVIFTPLNVPPINRYRQLADGGLPGLPAWFA